MPDLSDIDRRVRALQEEAIHAFEEKLKRRRSQQEQLAPLARKRQEQIRELMRASHIDLDGLDRLDHENEAASLDFVRAARPSVLEYQPRDQREGHKKLALLSDLALPHRKIIPVYAATLLASDPKSLEGIPGERGNPWVFPSNPAKVQIMAEWPGSSVLCGGAIARPQEPDASVTFYFPFTPDVTGLWYLTAYIEFHGFYLLYANRSWWNCDSARAEVEAVMNAYQYYWNSDRHFPLLDVNENNISEVERYDDTPSFDYSVLLAAGDLTWATTTVNIHTFSQGGGALSEVNFHDGSANYIQPIFLVAFHL